MRGLSGPLALKLLSAFQTIHLGDEVRQTPVRLPGSLLALLTQEVEPIAGGQDHVGALLQEDAQDARSLAHQGELVPARRVVEDVVEECAKEVCSFPMILLPVVFVESSVHYPTRDALSIACVWEPEASGRCPLCYLRGSGGSRASRGRSS